MPPPKTAIDYMPGAEYHQRRKHLQAHAIRCLEMATTTFQLPTSIIDFGCGEGGTVAWCRSKGINAIGVDLAIPTAGADWDLRHHDLREPLDLGISFDWVLCWEVAEHLESEFSEILCNTLVKHLNAPFGRLFFTAAQPGQRGPGHVNCQPAAFWRWHFQQRGLAYQEAESALLRDVWASEVPRAPWYARNIQVFAWA